MYLQNIVLFQLKMTLKNGIFEDELILDFNYEDNKPLISVNKDIVQKLKPHQVYLLF